MANMKPRRGVARWLGLGVVGLLTLSTIVIAGATGASAHHAELKLDAVCSTTPGQLTVTLQIYNSERNNPMTLKNVVATNFTAPTGATTNSIISSQGWQSFTFDIPAASGSISYKTSAYWPKTGVNEGPYNVSETLPTNCGPSTGSFSVKKRVTGDDDGYINGSTFTVDYTCTKSGQPNITGSLVLQDEETKQVNDIPTGMKCSFVESGVATPRAGFVYETPEFDPSGPVTIEKNKVKQVELKNRMDEADGQFELKKRVTGDTDGYVQPSDFVISYTCTGPGISPINGSLTLKRNESKTSPWLPTGASCLLTETTIPATTGPSYAYGTPVFDINPVIIGDGSSNTAHITLTNPINRVKGAITITKAISGDTAGYVPGSTFGFKLDCTGTAYDKTFTLLAGDSATYGEIPLGTSCKVTETTVPAAAANYAYGTPVVTPANGTVVINSATTPVTVGFNNPITQLKGGITVTKVISGDTAGYVADSTFGFDLDCDGDAYDTTLSLKAGDSTTVTDIPLGTSCTVTEVSVPAAAQYYGYTAPVVTPANGTVVVNSETTPVTVSFDNPIEHLKGSVTVSKVISGDTGGYVADSTFGFDLDCAGTTYDRSFNLKAGDSLTFDGIPLGTSCTVTETDLPPAAQYYAYGTPVVTPANGTVVVDSTTTPVTVSFDNPLVHLKGAVTVSKVISGDTAGYVADSLFGFNLDCDGEVYDATFTLKAGDSATYGDIPLGTSCTVSETTVPAAAQYYAYTSPVVTPANGTVVINSATTPVTVGFDNPLVHLKGGITISKVISGDTAGYVAGSMFGFDLDCAGDGYDERFTLLAGDSTTFGDIPLGTSCTVTEVDVPDAVDGYAYTAPVVTPEGGTVVINSDTTPVTVGFDNPLVHLKGGITISKVISGDTAGYVANSTFGFSLDCDGTTYDKTFTLLAGASTTYGDIPLGTSCKVAETAVPAAAQYYAYNSPVITPGNGTVVINSETTPVTVSFDNPIEHLKGSVTVSKVISGDTDGYVADSEFGFDLDCAGTDYDETFTLPAGDSATFGDIPLGTSCTVTEVDVPDAVDGYAYTAPVVTPEGGTVVVDSTTTPVTVSFDNPLVWLSVPEASIVGDCASNGALVTLRNAGGGEVVFAITVDGEQFGPTHTVGSTDEEIVEVPLVEGVPAEIEVFAGDEELIASEVITLDCQDPKVDSIVVECAEGGAVVTLSNDGVNPVDLTVKKNGEVVETVEVGDEPVEVLVPLDEGETALIEVFDGETLLDSEEVSFVCQDPQVDSVKIECADGGALVTLSNSGELPVELTVKKNGEVVKTVEVGTEPVEVLVPLDEGETALIEVFNGEELISTDTVAFDCTPPTTPSTVPPSTTSVPPTTVGAQVLGTTQTPAKGTLPVTGGTIFGGVTVALGLLIAGAALIGFSRRRS